MDKQLRPDKHRKEINLLKRDLYLDLFTKYIKNNNNFSFTKYGDGELKCIFSFEDGEKNCDNHPYSVKLAKLLSVSLVENCKRNNVFIGDWTGWNGDALSSLRDEFLHLYSIIANFVYYEALLNHDEINLKLVNLFKTVKESKRKKIFIRPDKLNEIKSILNIDETISVPETDSFSEYERIKSQALNLIEDNCIFVFSFGMASKVLTNDILSANSKVTILDVGSGFDPISLTKTRDGQVNSEEVRKIYKEILTF